MKDAVNSEIRDKQIRKRTAVRDLSWIKKVNHGFWLLEHVFKKSPIIVYENTLFTPTADWDGKAGYLDVQFKIPWVGFNRFPYWRSSWIMVVESLDSFMMYQGVDDARTELWHISNDMDILRSSNDPVEFWQLVKPKIKGILASPIIEFDEIWTNQEYFEQDDVIKYAKIWLEKYYPNLAKRKIIFDNYERTN